MTSRIYVQGDIASPLSLKIYDADTHVELTDVLFMDVTVSVTSATEATLHHRNKGSTVVDVSPAPSLRPAKAPATRCAFDLEVWDERSHTGSGKIVQATLKRPGEQDYHVRRAVGDAELANAADPAFVMEMHRLSAIQDVLSPVIDAMAKKQPPATATSRMSNGGVVSNAFPHIPGSPTTSLFPPPKDYDVLEHINKQSEARTHRQPCQECKGTGEVELFNGTVPCSTCAPDLGNNTSMAYYKEDQFGTTAQDLLDGIDHMQKLTFEDKVVGKVINCRCKLSPINAQQFGGFPAFIDDTPGELVWPAENGKEVNEAMARHLAAWEKEEDSYSFDDIRPKGDPIGDGSAEQSILEVIKRNSEKIHDTIVGRTPVDTGFSNPCKEIDLGDGHTIRVRDMKDAAARFMEASSGATESMKQLGVTLKDLPECPDCKGTGKVTLFTSEEDCSTCCD